MARSLFVLAVAVAAISALAVGAYFLFDEPPRPPHVVLISIDSLRPDRLGCYGADRDVSPTMDRLAREGTLFETAISTTSWTLPAHAALFTGLPDRVHNCYEDTKWLDGSRETLAEAFKNAGYRTAGFFSGPYLHPGFGLAQGFEEYHDCTSYSSETIKALQEKSIPQNWMEASHRDITNPIIVDEVKKWLGRRAESEHDRPTFTFIHFWDVHYDYIAPKADRERYCDPSYRGSVDGTDVLGLATRPADWTPADDRQLLALYDAEIRWTDAAINKVLDELRGAGLLDDAIIAIVADHGEAFYEHDVQGHRHSLHAEEIRIPWILHAPGRVSAARHVSRLASITDVGPTLLDLAGLPPLPHALGRSFRPLIGATGNNATPDETKWEASEQYAELVLPGVRHHFAIRTDEWKMMIDVDTGQFRVYDLVDDPGEEKPLEPKDYPLPKAVLERRYREAATALDRTTQSLPRPGERDTPRIDKMTERQLRALGYLR